MHAKTKESSQRHADISYVTEAQAEAYGRSLPVIVGATVLSAIGVVVVLSAVLLVMIELIQQEPAGDIGDAARRSLYTVASTALLLGLFHVLLGVYVLAHRTWARILAFILAILGLLSGTSLVVGGSGADGPRTEAIVTGIVLIIAYGLVALAMTTGGAHFRRLQQGCRPERTSG